MVSRHVSHTPVKAKILSPPRQPARGWGSFFFSFLFSVLTLLAHVITMSTPHPLKPTSRLVEAPRPGQALSKNVGLCEFWAFERLSSLLIKPIHLHGYLGSRKTTTTPRERNAAGFGEGCRQLCPSMYEKRERRFECFSEHKATFKRAYINMMMFITITARD